MRVDLNLESLRRVGISDERAADILNRVGSLPDGTPPPAAWAEICASILSPDMPFDAHVVLYDAIFSNWDESTAPRPAWSPSDREIEASNIAALCGRVGIGSAGELHAWSVRNRADFWRAVIDTLEIRFRRPPSKFLDDSKGPDAARWLVDSTLNIAESCFSGPTDAPAIVHQSEGGPLEKKSYMELDILSNRVANALCDMGIRSGDAVAIAMPMTVEAVAAYLGIVKAGGVVVSIADSFAPEEIRTRLRIANARTVFTQDILVRGGKQLPMYQKVVAAGAAAAVVVPQADRLRVTLRSADVGWGAFLSKETSFPVQAPGPDAHTNILFSSGTTGAPKAIPWTHATPIKCAMDGHLHHDIKRGDVVAWPTNLGWMMGPWLIYASLVNRATMALYYGPANTGEFCRFVQDAKVTMLGLVPSLVKAWRSARCIDGLDWTSVKVFSSTGECSNAEDYLYLMSRARYRPVIEYCGGTEIGGGYITGTVVQPASPATFSTPAFGLDFHILDDEGHSADNGELFLVPPSIGLSTELLNADHREVYYSGTPQGPAREVLRRHGDQMERLGGGYYRAHGRADDTMNLGGIKVSSAEIERAVESVAAVVETAAVAVSPPRGGPSQLVIFAVPEVGAEPESDELLKRMQRAIADNLNPLFRVHEVVLIDALPRTASNKVMRRLLRDRYKKT